MNLQSLDEWLGPRDSVALDPASMEFAERPAKSCRGCVFDGQWYKVCDAANAHAKQRGLPECEAGVIYVAVEKDARQLDLLRI